MFDALECCRYIVCTFATGKVLPSSTNCFTSQVTKSWYLTILCLHSHPHVTIFCMWNNFVVVLGCDNALL
jgi:hypothetical protein